MIDNAAFIIGLFAAWTLGSTFIYAAGAIGDDDVFLRLVSNIVGFTVHACTILGLLEFVARLSL